MICLYLQAFAFACALVGLANSAPAVVHHGLGHPAPLLGHPTPHFGHAIAHPVAHHAPVVPVAHHAPIHHAVHAAPVVPVHHAAPLVHPAPVHHVAHAAPVVHAAPAYAPAPAPYHEPKGKDEPYAFQYGVSDDYSKANFNAAESSDGNVVSGSYSVALPDGRIQHVKYTADHYNGYVAEVTYEGTPVYPEAKPYAPAPAYAPIHA